MRDLDDLDLPVDDVVDVWFDLERALAGKNGYGGDVAEIYAYRLVPQRIRWSTEPSCITGTTEAAAQTAKVEAARAAGVNLTRLLRRFVELHDGAVISIQEGRDEFRDLDLSQDFPPFEWRVHLLVSPKRRPPSELSTRAIRTAIGEVAKGHEDLLVMLDELVAYRATARLYAEAAKLTAPLETFEDLPPDAPTGLYLDKPFSIEDLAWIKMAFEMYSARHDGGPKRISQLMLVCAAIQRDARATQEFLRVMNSNVLPLLRRLRLKEQPHLTKPGADGE